MKAIVLHGVSEPEALRPEDVADPTPGPAEAVVRLRAAALNHRDLNICCGQYANLRFPIIPGFDPGGVTATLRTLATVAAKAQAFGGRTEEWLPNGAHRILPSSVLGRLLRAATGHP